MHLVLSSPKREERELEDPYGDTASGGKRRRYAPEIVAGARTFPMARVVDFSTHQYNKDPPLNKMSLMGFLKKPCQKSKMTILSMVNKLAN